MPAVFNSDKAQPFSQWEVVEVTFPSTPDTDVIVPHTLSPPNPDAVSYVPLRASAAGDVYHDITVTRKAWQNTYVVLRCSAASVKARILLVVEHSNAPAFAF